MRPFSSWPLATLLAGGLVMPLTATAQQPTITGLSPTRNLRNAARASDVAVTFSLPMSNVVATQEAVRVFSQQRGGRMFGATRGVASVSGSTITFNPTNDFKPGETVLVTTTTAATASGGGALATAHVHQFTAAVGGTGGGNFPSGTSTTVGSSPRTPTVADIDGDGDLDLLSPNFNAGTVSVRVNNGSGTFSGTTNVSVGVNPLSAVAADIDGDGDLDLLAPSYNGTVSIRPNNGGGAFSTGGFITIIAANSRVADVAVGDVDGDGDLDLFTANLDANSASVRLNSGSGAFGGATNVAVGSGPIAIAVADVDADGDLDLLTGNGGSSNVSVRLNNGSGAFSGTTNVAVGANPGPGCLAVADVDADGDLDLLVANNGTGATTVSVRLNNGSGAFSGGSDVSVGGRPNGLAVGDVDGDGDMDFLASIFGSNVVALRLNDGSGAFSAAANADTGANFQAVALGDVDGDGDLDLLSPEFSGSSVRVRFNQPFAPALTSLNPTTGPVGTSVTLTGTHLTGATGVSFNGTSAPVTVVNATTATATVPVGATSGNVTITTPGGASNAVSFTVITDLTVSAPQSVAPGTYNSVTVTGTGVATLAGPLTVTAALTVQGGGELNTNCQPLTGAGDFTLAAGATLRICDPAGISASGATGAVQVTGTRSFASDATYVYNGSQAQVTGSGLPAPVRELETANAAGVSLSQATAITDALRLTNGTLTTGGQLTLLSTATRTAYAVHNGGLTSGNVTVQRYIGGPTIGGYRHLSSPVQSTTVADLTTTGYAPMVNSAFNNLPYVAPPAASFPNIFGYEETRGGVTPAYAGFSTGYFSPATTGATLTSGRGWSVFMPGAKTPDFVGDLTTGNLPVTLTVTGTNSSPNQQKAGWHLLGNRYPQPIDWDLATVPAGMSGSISVFRTQGGNNGQYLTRANGVGNLPNGEIALGQAFFARATVDNTVFTFTNALRVEANPATVARPVADTRPTVRLTLQSKAPDAVADETMIYAETGATTGEDNRFDGLRPGRNTGNVPTLATVIAGQEAAVNGLPLESLTTGQTVVELTAALPTAGTYLLTAADVANLPTGTTVSLLDRKLNVTQPLTAGTAYQLTAATAGEVLAGRFALVFNANRVTGTHSSFLIPHSSLIIAPNPVATGGTLRVTGTAAGSPLTLFDATGRAVATVMADATGAATVPMRGLAGGVYVLRAGGAATRLVVE